MSQDEGSDRKHWSIGDHIADAGCGIGLAVLFVGGALMFMVGMWRGCMK